MSSDRAIPRDSAALSNLLAPEIPGPSDRTRSPRPDPLAASRSLQFESLLDRAAAEPPANSGRNAGWDRAALRPDRPVPPAGSRPGNDRLATGTRHPIGNERDRTAASAADRSRPATARPEPNRSDTPTKAETPRRGAEATSQNDRAAGAAERQGAEASNQVDSDANNDVADDMADGDVANGVADGDVANDVADGDVADGGAADGDVADGEGAAAAAAAALLAPPAAQLAAAAPAESAASAPDEVTIAGAGDGTGAAAGLGGAADGAGSVGATTMSTPDSSDQPETAAGDADRATGAADVPGAMPSADHTDGETGNGDGSASDQPASGGDGKQEAGSGPMTAPMAGASAAGDPSTTGAEATTTSIATGVPGGGAGAETSSTVAPAVSSGGSSNVGVDSAPGPLVVDPGVTSGAAASSDDGDPLSGAAGPDPVWRQIQRGINAVRLNAAGEHEMTIRLRPEELGSVVVTVTTGESGTTVSLVADNRSAANQLQQQRHLLLEQLEDRGLGGTTVDVGFGDHARQGDPDAQTGGGGLGGAFGGPGPSGRVATLDAGRTAGGRSTQSTRSLVDIAL